MRPTKSTERYTPLLVLVLLLLTSVLLMAVLHNISLESGNSIPLWAKALSLTPFLLGIWFYIIAAKQNSIIAGLQNQIETLKSQLESFIKSQKQTQTQSATKETIDIGKWVNNLLPNASADDLVKYGESLLANISKSVEIVQGIMYLKDSQTGLFKFKAGYAYFSETTPPEYPEGETLAGQVAKNQKLINLSHIPDGYITILSGLGKGSPKHLVIAPIISPESKTIGILELASFKEFKPEHEELFALLGRKLGEKLSVTNQ